MLVMRRDLIGDSGADLQMQGERRESERKIRRKFMKERMGSKNLWATRKIGRDLLMRSKLRNHPRDHGDVEGRGPESIGAGRDDCL